MKSDMKGVFQTVVALVFIFFFDTTHMSKEIPLNNQVQGASSKDPEVLKSLTCIIRNRSQECWAG